MNHLSLVTCFGASLTTLVLAEVLSPSLQVLPLNSTLSNVTIPRFDKDQKRIAYLKSNLMEILPDGEEVEGKQNIMVDCTGIQLRMPIQEQGDEIKVDMDRARYRITPGVLSASETITVDSKRFSLRGTGGVFHLDSHRGFVFGPLDCTIAPKEKSQAHLMKPTPLFAMLATSASLIAQEPSANYTPLTEAESLAVDRLALPSGGKITEENHQNTAFLTNQLEEAAQTEKLLAQFEETVNSESLTLLIQNPPKPIPAATTPPSIEDPSLTVNCDGGAFFDGKENLLVFLRNVIVKEERFTLKANQEMKILFKEKPASADDEKEKKSDYPSLSVGDFKTLIATGGVNFTGIDKEGNPVEATAALATYDDVTKKLILKDGKPTFWYKKGEAEFQLISADNSGSVVIDLSGEAMSASASKTGWRLGAKDLPIEKK